MQKILQRRILRELKENFFRYLALGSLIILSMYMVVSLVAAAETVINRVEEMSLSSHLEDGEFTVFTPLSKEQISEMKEAGVTLEPMFYLDYQVSGENTLRFFENRKELNRLSLDSGRMAEASGEVVVEKRYCQENSLILGDEIQIGGQSLKIVGIGTVPDYDAPYKELSDSSVDSEHFGLAFVSDKQYEELKAKEDSLRSESYGYAYAKDGTITDDGAKEMLVENLIQFITREDNPRVQASANDQVINKVAGLIAGIIILILFTYVISVFVIHNIEQESSVIGSLYALGVRKRELICHYLTLPVIVTVVAGVIGTCIGFSKIGLDVQMQECYDYFSVPRMIPVYPAYLVAYGILLPPLIVISVNYLIMNKKLARPVLSLITKEQKKSRISSVKLGKMGFIGRFRIRQMLRELRSTGTVLFGLFISLLILMLGLDCYVMCIHISQQNKEDTKFEYMYTYKYPGEKVPEGGQEGYAMSLKKENLGYQLDVTLLGIEEENPYFNAQVQKGKNKVVLSSAAAQKFGLKKGGQVVLTDQENGRDYVFTIEDITQYSTGLYAFMDIESMRKLFGQEATYFNVAFSKESLEIPSGQLYAVTTKEDIVKSSDVFISRMMTGVATLVFGVVMYLMIKVMIDRSSFGISLLKVFGYRTREIGSLYLNGNFYVIAIGAALCLPASKVLMDAMYPVLVANVGCAMDLSFSWQLYLGIYIGILVLYLAINKVLAGKVKRVLPADILKNRE